MKHANYKYLQETGKLESQYIKDDRATEHLACGEFVAKMYKEYSGQEIPYIRNILAPKKKVEKIYRFISTSRVYDEDKGWNEIIKFCSKLKKANIKFEFLIFSKLPPNIVRMDGTIDIPFKEIHVYEPQLDILDYVADADYVVLFTKSEGCPYSIQEALQYGTACIVSDVGGCTELIQDGVNGYVIKDLDKFDIEKIKKIPKLKAYTGTSIDEWCDYLGGAEYKKKPLKEQPKVKIQAIQDYTDMVLGKDITEGDIYEVTPERANEIVKGEYAKIWI